MNVLVLGGTAFVGRAVVDDLLGRGHAPTLFTRGVTNPDLFPQVPRLTGDRDTGDYASLTGRAWDAVVDVSCYLPRQLNQALDAVTTDRYLFVSTGSVYSPVGAAASGMAEDSAGVAPWREDEVITGETYGRLKVACEDDLRARLGDRATIVRPGVVAGPHDTSDRFTYWVRRAARGGRVAVPGDLDQPVQGVDSRDLARLVTLLLEADAGLTLNAVGPADPVTLGELVRTCALAAGTEVELVPVPTVPRFPLVMSEAKYLPLQRRSAAAARAFGMPGTPLRQTAADVLAWDRERGEPPLVEGWTPEQEAAELGDAAG